MSNISLKQLLCNQSIHSSFYAFSTYCVYVVITGYYFSSNIISSLNWWRAGDGLLLFSSSGARLSLIGDEEIRLLYWRASRSFDKYVCLKVSYSTAKSLEYIEVVP